MKQHNVNTFAVQERKEVQPTGQLYELANYDTLGHLVAY
jgi:hypothetical protein